MFLRMSSLIALIALVSMTFNLRAQPLPEAKTSSNQLLIPDHRWVVPPLRHDPAAFFTNLKNGETVTSPFVVRFGMAYWGIAPAEHKHARTGHHHLLVDTPLPMQLNASLPFSKNYVHFGGGQMQTVLDLPAGRHTLRLLLADFQHVPLVVFSDEITVTVSGRDPKKAEQLKNIQPELLFPNLKDGDAVLGYFKVQFHAAGLNISNKLSKLPNTGYFQLKIMPSSGRIERIPFPGGQTETWLKLPEGDYKLQLEFLKNPTDEVHTVTSPVIAIKVKGR